MAGYTDQALTAVAEEDSEHMGLYNQNEAARVAVQRELRVANKASVQANGQTASAKKANGVSNGAANSNGKGNATGNGKGQPKLTVKPAKPFPTREPANESAAESEKAPAA